ncbi:acyltransferase family protein [Pseudaminobacter sp. NGMCC 1.201702]|uniref:acyltransferase family protein n=1 Tax=Pseudaminobacter sp. NGMCC 1.201702 TaxID=3391825 RepID=UPI0039F02295
MAQTTFLDSTRSSSTILSARSTAVAAGRFEALDSWRGICALLVALFHFPATGFISQSAFISSSYLFVDFFFVLSGFVITSSYASRLDSTTAIRRFALVRFGRIYPLHLFMLAAFVGFELLRLLLPQLRGNGAAPFTGSDSIGSLFTNLFLLHGIGFENQLTWNAPSWSISAEFFAYLFFAAAMFVAGRRAWMFFVVAPLVAPLLLLAFSATGMDVSWDFGFVRCLYGFSLGALLSWFQHDAISAVRREIDEVYSRAERLAWTLVELGAIAMIVLFVSSAGKGNVGIAAPFVFVIALYVFAHEGGWVSALLRSRAMLLLGALSYSIYMVHIFVQGRLFNLAGLVDRKLGGGLLGEIGFHGGVAHGFGPESAMVGLAATAIMLALTLVASYCTWRLVEMPALAWFRRLSKRI